MGILKNLIIATTGTHIYLPKQIQGWIERNGGRYSPTVHEGVTHLLASEVAYKSKQRTEAVHQALSLGIQILSYDWLDDSLNARKKLPVKSYVREVLSDKRRMAKKLKRLGAEADGKKFREGCEEIMKLTGSVKDTSNPPTLSTIPTSTTLSSAPNDSRTQAKSHRKAEYHYYQDTTGFDYKITLIQSDISNNITAKYHIGLLESHTKPHTYWGLAQYQPVEVTPTSPLPTTISSTSPTTDHKNPDITRVESEKSCLLSLISPPPPNPTTSFTNPLCPRNASFAIAWRSFRHAFHDLTLIPWESRFDAHATSLQKREAARLDVEPYRYVRPRLGMPVGVFPQAGDLFTCGEKYVRGTVGIALFEGELDENGAFGAVVVRERERERVEEERRRIGGVEVQEGEKKRKREGRLGDGVDGRGFVAPEFAHLLRGVGGRK
ncbi:hypothetical protein COCSADRAFT_348315 [Bipolaris sorokiniana ND90Pr]|uniref:BRCT domain-containing protein n=1 Tax=Cochliobolus sativus (strain ND90Pr / ATCC 201652) TaxID=665912 RepID=M2RUU1_COCSN|nr:uncharacterized protein COCSADRAFT_348315 [Bipolaris sorokiniana ND90Pr]EMD58893.1 hypothetical protein COCSADRAFT_348315 [Bipolaris sorokiniana ND90Pr]